MAEEQEKKKTILIVDDTKENVDLLEAILSAEYTIKRATQGNEALEIARVDPPDLVLLDIMMPGMDGYEVCRALKTDTTTQRIPVIFVTALLNLGDETRGFEAGGVDYITKPVIGAVVRARVKAHLALKEAQDEMEEWNGNLKRRLLQSITTIRKKTEALMSAEEKASDLHGYVLGLELLSRVFERMEDRFSVSSLAVSALAGDAARKLNLPAEAVAKVRLAGLLHDAGTLGPKRGFSEKQVSKMITSELEEYHTHPIRGQELFKSFEDLQDVGLMVRYHHENYGGGGFPDDIKGDDIPLGARLLAIADFIEHAARSASGDGAEYALMSARLNVGTRLDPRLVPYFTLITRILYFGGNKSETTGEVAVPPEKLIAGLVISRDIVNHAGALLLQKGDTLDPAAVTLIRRNSRINNSEEQGVWVFARNETVGNIPGT